MDSVILAGTGAATYDRILPPTGDEPTPPEPAGEVEIDLSGDPPDDTVEITGTEPAPFTYGPRGFEDRFQFDLQNGLLDPSRRFSPLPSRYRGMATAGYAERQSVETQVTRMSGTGSAASALFSLQYLDANPSPDDATTEVLARTEFARIADRNLEILHSL